MFGFYLVGISGGPQKVARSASIENSSYPSHKYAGSVLINCFKKALKCGVHWECHIAGSIASILKIPIGYYYYYYYYYLKTLSLF